MFEERARRWLRRFLLEGLLLLFLAGCAPSSPQVVVVADPASQATISALETQVARQQLITATPTIQAAAEATVTVAPTMAVPTSTAQDPALAPANTLPPATPTQALPSPTPLPTLPVKGKVLGIERHHSPLLDEKLAQFAAEKGWEVVEIDVEPLTEEYLQRANVSILAIQNATKAFTEGELQAIHKFVENGGGLLLQADQQRSRRGKMALYAKDIAKRFGVSISDEAVPWVNVPVQSDHPLLKDVTVFAISSNNDEREPVFLVANAPAYVVLNAGMSEPYKPILAAAEAGSGRVVIYPTMFNDLEGLRPYEAWSLGDNLYFLRNALYWLQQESVP